MVVYKPKSTKAKILERLELAVNNAPPTKNRSPELVPLTAEFEKMKKNRTFLSPCVYVCAFVCRCVCPIGALFKSISSQISLRLDSKNNSCFNISP